MTTYTAEILDTLPISGSIDEVDFFQGSNDLIWVQFTSSDGKAWCGKLLPGIKKGSSEVAVFDQNLFFVLAQGQGYLVDAELRQIREKTAGLDIDGFIVDPVSKTLLMTNGQELSVRNGDGSLWRSKRFAFDGVLLQSVSNGTLTGTYDDLTDEWAKFSFEISTRSLKCERPIDFQD